MSNQYEKLKRQFDENTELLEKKEQIVARVMGEKVQEINELKGFIEEIGKNSKTMVKKYSKDSFMCGASDDALFLQRENSRNL
jgi:hypothetical protein